MHIIRYGEIALKGKNRGAFERKLVGNIRDCFFQNNKTIKKVIRIRGRIYLDADECNELANVFGIVSYSVAIKTEFSIDKLKQVVDQILPKKFKTFRVSAHRVDKSIKMKSSEINITIGQHIVDNYQKKVSLKEHDLDVGIEIYDSDAYIYVNKTKGPGGLPYGINGTAAALIENPSSLLAAWLVMKRGVRVFPIAYTDQDISLMKKYSYGSTMNLKIIDKITSQVIVTNQTLKILSEFDQSVLHLRPLGGFSKEEISAKLKAL